MANPNLLSSGKVSDIYGQGAVYNITLADLQAIGATTSGNIILDNLPAGAIVHLGKIKHSVALVGAGPVTAATVRVATANNNYGAAAFDVFQAVSDTARQIFGPAATTPVAENENAVTPIYATVTLTGGNASGLTAGRIQVWIRYTVLK